MISFKEYATEHRISYEAVRKQVSRYEKELAGHIEKRNRKQYLDDYAVKFLDERRNSNVVAVLSDDIKNEAARNEELQEENKQLLYKIAQLEEQLRDAEKDQGKMALIEANIKKLEASHETISAENKELTTKVAQLEKDKEYLAKENAALEQERDSYVPSIFGLFRKKKPVSVK